MDIALPLEYDEKNLIMACARQERWAQKVLYEEYYSQMMGVCLRYSNGEEEALDILHEGFIGKDPIAVRVDNMSVALGRREADAVVLASESPNPKLLPDRSR